MLADALEHLVRGIVDNPDDVTVTSRSLRRGDLLEVRVNPEDLGRVTSRSLRRGRPRTSDASSVVRAALPVPCARSSVRWLTRLSASTSSTPTGAETLA